jgi:hypothetical protein
LRVRKMMASVSRSWVKVARRARNQMTSGGPLTPTVVVSAPAIRPMGIPARRVPRAVRRPRFVESEEDVTRLGQVPGAAERRACVRTRARRVSTDPKSV